MRLHSLRTRLALYAAGLAALAVLAASVLFERSARREFRIFTRSQDAGITESIANEVRETFEQGRTWDGAENLFDSLARATKRHLILLDSNGAVIAAGPRELASAAIRRSGSQIDVNARRNGSEIAVQFRIAGIPIRDASLYVLPPFLNQSPPPPRDPLRISMIVAAIVAVCGAVLFALPLSGAVMRPLANLTRVARAMEGGDLTQRIEVRRRDEVGELGAAFNALADSLARNERLRREMVNDVAHELRTPLTNLRCQVESMVDGLVPASAENLASLNEELLHLSRLVDDLRDLALAEARQLRLEMETVEVAGELEQIVKLHEPAASRARVALRVEGEPCFAMADRGRLRQVLRNLVTNAINHTAAGGVVELRAARDGDWVAMEVRDSGVGIAAEHLPFVFDRFYRSDASRDRRSGGAGLGLAIVKHLTEAQGGTVGVESTVGVGTSFIVRLGRSEAHHKYQGNPTK